jgi:hypothetical protein
MGVDQCTVSMQIDDVGAGGLDAINSQIVSVDPTNGHYLETGAALTDTFRMFSSAGWGSHAVSAYLQGGNVRLQLFHVSAAAKIAALAPFNNANLRNLDGNVRDSLPTGQAFLSLAATANAACIGNVINTPSAQMPVNTVNVISVGNHRVGASPLSGSRRSDLTPVRMSHASRHPVVRCSACEGWTGAAGANCPSPLMVAGFEARTLSQKHNQKTE